jgi:D-sedoheptulose 7-phosphate isomerase
MELTFQSMESMEQILEKYRDLLVKGFDTLATNPSWPRIQEEFARVRKRGAGVFLAGNGGSAANANHLATDLLYGANSGGNGALRVHSLSANPSVMTCLGNDTKFENIFAQQLEALAVPGDLLLAFSGSGNSPNIVQVLAAARRLKVFSVSFLGFDGGQAKALSDLSLHFPVHDMQVAEDLHMIAGHLLLKSLQ